MKALTTCFLLIAGCGLMNASIIFTPGNNPSNDVNILMNSGATGTTVTGTPNGFPSVTVNFTSTQVLTEPSSGQARVSASPEGTPLTNLTISLANGMTYGDLIMNPFIGGQCPTCTGGQATITVMAVNNLGIAEAPVIYTGLNVSTNSNNFLTITTSGGEAIVSTSISVPGGFNDLRQPRISGPFGSLAIPEPGTCVMLLSGAGLFGIARRLRSRGRA